jgi:hypothetical protein
MGLSRASVRDDDRGQLGCNRWPRSGDLQRQRGTRGCAAVHGGHPHMISVDSYFLRRRRGSAVVRLSAVTTVRDRRRGYSASLAGIAHRDL